MFEPIGQQREGSKALLAIDDQARLDGSRRIGNLFQDDGSHEVRVRFASSHQWPLYPGTGAHHETGRGNIANAPLPQGADGAAFLAAWDDELLPFLDAFRPQLVLVSAGFDAHLSDPLADLMLEAEDFAWITGELRTLATRHAGGRLVSMLEGGYNLEALAECAVAHVGALRA